MTLKIGLTGGIGSGKSTVARMFQALGVTVYYADKVAKELYDTDPVIRSGVIEIFGEYAYIDGLFNKPWVALQVFKDDIKLEKLNHLVHPATIRHAMTWFNQQTGDYAIKEAALIFESGAQDELDLIIGVSAPESLRIKRVMERDGSTEAEVRARIQRQMDEQEKMRLCDIIIINDDHHLLIPQVLAADKKIKAIRAQRKA